MAETWTYLLSGRDPELIALLIALGVILATIMTWPWGLYDDYDEE